MGGKSKSSNDQMIAFQMQQAQEARQKEAERQARLTQGKSTIDALFQGGGFDDTFYNKYKNASLDFSLPQLQDQYKKARDDLTYSLARAGTLRSTAAGQAQADVESQNIANEAGIRAKADADVASLRSNVIGEQQQALNQLYATEDPDVAANTAIQSVQQTQLAQPNLSPLGDLFRPLVVGGASGLSNIVDQYNINRGLGTTNPLGAGSGKVVNAV